MNYFAITQFSLKRKAGFCLRGVSFGQVLSEISPEMLSLFLGGITAQSVLFVSTEKILYAGLHSSDPLPPDAVIYIITEDAEVIWEAILPEKEIDLPF